MNNFTKLNKQQFFGIFDCNVRYTWIGDQSEDLNWAEAHIDFIYDTEEQRTVGFKRSSSYGAEDEYEVLTDLVLDKDF